MTTDDVCSLVELLLNKNAAKITVQVINLVGV